MDMDHDLDCVKQILLESSDFLSKNLQPDDILRTLKSKGALKQSDVSTIKNEITPDERVDKFLEILLRKPVSAYDAFMSALATERGDLYKVVKDLEEKYNYKPGNKDSVPGTSRAANMTSAEEQISEKDITDVSDTLDIDEFPTLYTELGLKDRDVRKEKASCGSTDSVKLKERRVLLYWRRISGREATRKKILDALKELNFTESLQDLEKKWTI